MTVVRKDFRVGIDASNIRHGGGLTHLAELLVHSRPEDHGVSEVIVWGGRFSLEQLSPRPWLKLVHAPELDGKLPWRLWWQKYELPRLAGSSCDLLYAPGGLKSCNFRPFVTMSQNLLPFEEAEKQRFGYSWTFHRLNLLRYGQGRSFQQADGVIFLTQYARQVVLRSVGAITGLTTIIPHGISSRFRRPPRVQKPLEAFLPEHPFRWLYVSVIDLYKHQWRVAAAVSQLRKSGLPVSLDLIGGIKNKRAFVRLYQEMGQAEDAGDYLNYQGEISFNSLHANYQSADAFVFASSCENLPNILLEAMAAGLPVACSRRGPMPEVLGDAGVYFDPENVEDIQRAMRKLMQDSALRQSCANSAYEKAMSYSWEECAASTWSFLALVGKKWKNNKEGGQSECVESAELQEKAVTASSRR